MPYIHTYIHPTCTLRFADEQHISGVEEREGQPLLVRVRVRVSRYDSYDSY